MGSFSSSENDVKFRCFGNLFSNEAKECLVCENRNECRNEKTENKTIETSPIRIEIIKSLETGPKTIAEITEIVSKTSKRFCKGTTVFYHLSLMKGKGQLQIVEHNGKRCYSLYSTVRS